MSLSGSQYFIVIVDVLSWHSLILKQQERITVHGCDKVSIGEGYLIWFAVFETDLVWFIVVW